MGLTTNTVMASTTGATVPTTTLVVTTTLTTNTVMASTTEATWATTTLVVTTTLTTTTVMASTTEATVPTTTLVAITNLADDTRVVDTTTAHDSNVADTTTIHDGGASEDMSTVLGSITIGGLSFADLSADTTLKAAVETQCKVDIASAAGVNTRDVSVTLSSGSVVVDYTIAVAPNAVSSTNAGLTDAINDNSLTEGLVTDLLNIPNINSVADATLSATATVTTPTDAPAITSAARSTSVVQVSGLMAFAAFAVAQLK